MSLVIQQLIDLWGPPVAGEVRPDAAVGPICTDSRKLGSGDFFVPLVGERFDGHTFLGELPKLAAQAAVVSHAWHHPVPPDLLHWRVDDTLEAYQQLGLFHRRALQQPVVAITGSAGKTTTRELIRSVLMPLGPIQASTGNNNNDVGVPLTLLQADNSHRALVVEMGMRGPGEIARLSRCSEPDLAVITNIGTAHIGRLGSREAIAAAKCEIAMHLSPHGAVVIPAGDSLLDTSLARVWSGRVIRVRLDDDQAADADLIGCIDGDQIVVDGQRFGLPLDGRHNARNFLLAIAVAGELGVPLASLANLQVEVPGGRNRRLDKDGLILLDETYNASPEAVLAALDLLAAQPGRRFAVLGTMLELGDRSVELHAAIAARAAEIKLDGLVVVASDPEAAAMAMAAAAIERLAVVAEPEAAAEPLMHWLKQGDVVLLKASRGVALERLMPLLPRF